MPLSSLITLSNLTFSSPFIASVLSLLRSKKKYVSLALKLILLQATQPQTLSSVYLNEKRLCIQRSPGLMSYARCFGPSGSEAWSNHLFIHQVLNLLAFLEVSHQFSEFRNTMHLFVGVERIECHQHFGKKNEDINLNFTTQWGSFSNSDSSSLCSRSHHRLHSLKCNA